MAHAKAGIEAFAVAAAELGVAGACTRIKGKRTWAQSSC